MKPRLEGLYFLALAVEQELDHAAVDSHIRSQLPARADVWLDRSPNTVVPATGVAPAQRLLLGPSR